MKLVYPDKAIVLAAGFGSRLLPLSLDVPKPMIPLWGRPMLEHILGLLASWGVRDALFNLHHNPGPVLDYLRTQYNGGVRISFSFEPEILGTGGAVRKAAWFFGDSPFWMINADIAADLDPKPILEKFSAKKTLASLWMHERLGPRTVDMAGDCVKSFQSARPGGDGTCTFCGLQALSPEILKYLPESGFATITGAYERAMRRGLKIRGAVVPGCFWADVGTPESYIETHRMVMAAHESGTGGARLFTSSNDVAELRRKGVDASGFVSLCRNVSVQRGAVLKDCVIWDGAVIGSGAVVENAVVGRYVKVNGAARRLVARPELAVERGGRADGQLWSVLKALRWQPESITISPFEPRGSGRSFTRLQRGKQSVVMVRYSLERAENALYAGHARFLQQLGINVPEIILDLPAQRVLVLRDLGEMSLLKARVGMTNQELLKIYKSLLRRIVIMHERGAEAARRRRLRLVPRFSRELYRWEREFFAKHFLINRMGMPPDKIAPALNELRVIGAELMREPDVLVHRDLQSSNVLLKGRAPFLIDFQGMRFGAAAYDLASLLYDPYMELPESLREELFRYYCSLSARVVPDRTFRIAAVQRLAQALGAYARLGAMPATERFSEYIGPGLRMMKRAICQAGNLPDLDKALS